MDFFELPFQETSGKLANHVQNTGKKNKVLPETIKMLDQFFQPYNERLASLFGDKKWLFIRETKSTN